MSPIQDIVPEFLRLPNNDTVDYTWQIVRSYHDRELVIDRQRVTLISFKRLKTSPIRSEGRCGKRQIERLTLELKAFCDSRGSIFIISLSKMIASEKASNSLRQLQSPFHATCLTNLTTIAKLSWQVFFLCIYFWWHFSQTLAQNYKHGRGHNNPGNWVLVLVQKFKWKKQETSFLDVTNLATS